MSYTLRYPFSEPFAEFASRWRAVREARRRQRAGEAVILTGPDLPERLYAPDDAERPAESRPYRVRCRRCGEWRRERTGPGRGLCARCWQGSEEQSEHLAGARGKRWPRAENTG